MNAKNGIKIKWWIDDFKDTLEQKSKMTFWLQNCKDTEIVQVRMLQVSETKTKLMVPSPDQRHINLGQNFPIGEQSFGVTNEFIYLGPLLNSSSNESEEIKRRTCLQTDATLDYKNYFVVPIRNENIKNQF